MDARETVFLRWLEEYKGLMYKVCHLYADGPEDREDLLQEILHQVWVSIPSFKETAKATTWVYRVALNTALSWRRKEGKRPTGRSLVMLEEREDLETSEATSPEDKEALQAVYACICQLPKADCALALMYLNGLKYEEMADILGMSVTNIGVKLNRIRRTLTEMMKGY